MKRISPDALSPDNIIGVDTRYVLYRLDDETAIQKYLYKATLEEIEDEKTVATNTFRLGLPTLISFEPVQIGDDYGIVYENLGTRSLGNLIMSHPSRFLDYMGDFVTLAHRMHSTPVDQDMFPSQKEVFRGVFAKAETEGLYTHDEVSACRRMVDAVPEQNTYLHMAYGPRTTRYIDDELTLTQVTDAAYGHPVFDVSSTGLQTVFCAEASGDTRVELSANTNAATAKLFWGSYIRQYFDCTSHDDAAEMERLMYFAQWLRLASVPVLYPGLMQGNEGMLQSMLRERFFPYVDQWIADMDGVWDRFKR